MTSGPGRRSRRRRGGCRGCSGAGGRGLVEGAGQRRVGGHDRDPAAGEGGTGHGPKAATSSSMRSRTLRATTESTAAPTLSLSTSAGRTSMPGRSPKRSWRARTQIGSLSLTTRRSRSSSWAEKSPAGADLEHGRAQVGRAGRAGSGGGGRWQVLQAEGVMVAPPPTARITPARRGRRGPPGRSAPAGGKAVAGPAPAARKPSLKWIFLPSA